MGPRFSAAKNLKGAAFRLPAPQMRLKLAAETFDYIWLRIAAGEHQKGWCAPKRVLRQPSPLSTVVARKEVMPAWEITFARGE
jgi:hypothetical protein